MIAFNGFSPSINIVNSVEEFNPNTNAWTVISQTEPGLGNAVTHNGAVKIGNDVWLIGGRIGNHPGAVSNKVWIFNIQNKTWRQGPKLPRPFAGGGAALVGNTIHVFGGLDAQAQCDVNFHYTYNLQSNNGWNDITSQAGMPLPRNHFSTIAVNNKIYALGGQNTHGGCGNRRITQTNHAHVFNPANNQWTRLPDLPFARSHAEPSTFENGGLIYMVGGATNGNMVITYNPSSNKWNVRNDLTLPVQLLAPAARIFGNRFVVALGGVNGPGGSSTVTRELILAGSNDPAPSPAPVPPPAPAPAPAPDGASQDQCAVTASSLSLAIQQYSASCSLPRKDCDPTGGGWTCSSHNMTNGSAASVISLPNDSVSTPVSPPAATSPQHCTATGPTLDQAKIEYAANCSLPRKDCDPIDGSWTCSSENI